MKHEPFDASQITVIAANANLRRLLAEGMAMHGCGQPNVYGTTAKIIDGGLDGTRLVILASSAPGMDVVAFRKMLDGQAAAPALIGVFLSEVTARESGLSAQDSFTLPLRLGALLDRIRRIVAGTQGEAGRNAAINIGPYRLVQRDGALVSADGGGVIHVTEKERDILLALDRHRGHTVGRKELLESVWGYVDGIETHTLETHIYRLRQKIEQDPANPAFLLTEESGYRLV